MMVDLINCDEVLKNTNFLSKKSAVPWAIKDVDPFKHVSAR
jgi:hypothetical protein